MPLPRHNAHFEQGDFRGYTTKGICQIAKQFSAFNESRVYLPVSGSYFAVLDDPRDIDGDGARTTEAAAYPPADTTQWSLTPDADGRTTLGSDGAILQCEAVTIEPGQALWFHWAFARFDWSPANDFAVFEAYADHALDQPPLYHVTLVQSLELERQNRWSTEWQVYSWRPAMPFTGTVRWIVSNGLSTSIPLPRPGGKARPSALLLDCVKID